MKNKYQITEKQREQFNKMRATLILISKGYETPDKLRKISEKEYGLDFEECLQSSYENIQAEAAFSVKGVKGIAGEFGI